MRCISFRATQVDAHSESCIRGEELPSRRVRHSNHELDMISLTLSSTIGAGDTFIAGMLYGLTCHSHDWTLAQKLSFANELAGRKVGQEGFSGLGTLMQHGL